MTTSKAQLLASKKYRQNNIEVLSVDVRKGKKAEYKAAAVALGLSQMEMIRRAIEEFITNHTVDKSAESLLVMTTPAEKNLTAEQRKILDAVDKLSPNAQKALLKFLQSLQDTDEKSS